MSNWGLLGDLEYKLRQIGGTTERDKDSYTSGNHIR